jgi:hypothetical protein
LYLLLVGVILASAKSVAAEIFLSIQLIKQLIGRVANNGHAPRTLSAKGRVQQAVTTRQIDEIAPGLIKRPF